MFPKNGSGVDAAGDCGAWELDERATKQSGHADGDGCTRDLMQAANMEILVD